METDRNVQNGEICTNYIMVSKEKNITTALISVLILNLTGPVATK